MATLKRGVIKSYSAANHRASVQIAGSLAVWLANVPVATDIPAGSVVAGRECAVLFFADDNPDDAVIVTVHGAVPNDDQLQIGRLGVNTAPVTADLIRAIDTTSPDQRVAVQASLGLTLNQGAGAITGVAGYCLAKNPSTLYSVGLDYLAGAMAQSLSLAAGIRLQLYLASYAGKTCTDGRGIHLKNPYMAGGGAALTNASHLFLDALTTGTNRTPIYEQGSGAAGDAHGNRFRSNTMFGALAGAFGGGDGVIGIANATANPNAYPAGGGVLYVTGGALTYRGSAGTVTTIAPA